MLAVKLEQPQPGIQKVLPLHALDEAWLSLESVTRRTGSCSRAPPDWQGANSRAVGQHGAFQLWELAPNTNRHLADQQVRVPSWRAGRVPLQVSSMLSADSSYVQPPLPWTPQALEPSGLHCGRSKCLRTGCGASSVFGRARLGAHPSPR